MCVCVCVCGSALYVNVVHLIFVLSVGCAWLLFFSLVIAEGNERR